MTARPLPSTPGVTLRMRRQARKDTRPELQLRGLIHAAGLRYRVGLRVPGMARRTIDIAFTRIRLAVFIDGCFWHGCPQHATWPTANADWWADKIHKNQARDAATTHHLRTLGWQVLRVWEHEPADEAATAVVQAVHSLRAASEGTLPESNDAASD